MRIPKRALITALAVLLVACVTQGLGAEIEGSWELTSGALDGSPIALVEGYPIIMIYDGVSFGGRAACNRYSTSFEGRNGSLKRAEISMTSMACGGKVTDSESQFTEALSRVEKMETNGPTLGLSGDGVLLLFSRMDPVPTSQLLEKVWVLEMLDRQGSSTPARGQPATLEMFSDGSVLGSTGCRSLHGEYVISGPEVILTSFAAEGDCPADLTDQDGLVVNVLGDGFQVEIDGDALTLTSMGGEGLVYRATG